MLRAGTLHPSWSSRGGISEKPSAASSRTSSHPSLSQCPALSPLAHVNRMWCEAASEGPWGAPRAPQCTCVSQRYGTVRTNPGTDAKPLGEELVPALPYLSELEFGMFTSVYIAHPFPGRKGELHGAIAVPLLCQTPHPLPAGLRIGTNCPSWTFLGCEW